MLHLPLRAIHPLSQGPRAASLAYVQTTFDAPLFSRTEVVDVIGLPCAYDITINDGFYITIIAYLLMRTAMRWSAQWFIAARSTERKDGS